MLNDFGAIHCYCLRGFDTLIQGNLLIQWHQITSLETQGYYTVKTRSLYLTGA